MVCVKFKPNFSLKSYFFYLAQSLFKSSFIQFSISYSILFKYYFFIHFLLLFSTKLKPNRDTQKKNTATSSKFYNKAQQLQPKNPANLQTFTTILQKIINKFTNFHSSITENHQNQNNTSKFTNFSYLCIELGAIHCRRLFFSLSHNPFFSSSFPQIKPTTKSQSTMNNLQLINNQMLKKISKEIKCISAFWPWIRWRRWQ